MNSNQGIFVFDIETIPDVDAGRKIYRLHDLSDEDVGRIMIQQRLQQSNGSEFLPLHLHRVVAISVMFRHGQQLKLWTLGDRHATEKEIVSRFFDGIVKYTPTLVSWNGSGFDLPVLHYRALRHDVACPVYWDVGDENRDFKWNNYISRYHWRHIDIMDVVSGFQPRATAPMDQVATILGYPGKLGMDGSKVWDSYLDHQIDKIRNYCETDVLNTYLIYLRFEQMRGKLSPEQFKLEIQMVKTMLQAEPEKSHWQVFLQNWDDQPPVL